MNLPPHENREETDCQNCELRVLAGTDLIECLMGTTPCRWAMACGRTQILCKHPSASLFVGAEGDNKTSPERKNHKTSLRAEAEARLSLSPPKEIPHQSAEKTLHELRVHQIELEMQNEELRQAQVALEVSRDRFIDLYEFAPVGYFTLTRQGAIAEVNLPGATLLGMERKKLLARRFAHFVAQGDSERWFLFFAKVLQHSTVQSCELVLRRDDDTLFHAQLDFLHIQSGGESSVRIALTDISERKRADEALRIAAITFETQQGIILTDANAVILRVNQAFTQMTGFSAEEALGKTPAILKSGRQNKAFYEHMWAELKQQRYWQGEMWNRRKNGKIYAQWLTISAVVAPDGHVTHYVGAFSEITEHKEAAAEIHRLAYYDPLTGLPNRRLLYDRLRQALTSSRRSGHYGALLFLDMDNFKNLNDTRGHDVGDQLLVDASHRIQECVREGDTVARLGGDEFLVMLEDLSTDATEAGIQTRQVAEKIRDALALPYDLDDHKSYCTSSIGVTLFIGHNDTLENLLKQADLAMYKAKESGRNVLRFFDPTMQTLLDERSALEYDLRLALQRGQLRLFYQAQMDSARRVIGAEALLRWVHPERGLVQPGAFIALAEETGLILPIGHWVLQTACRQIKTWSASENTRELCLAVNVSALQFRQPEFVAEIAQVLQESGADPARLKIELTESMVLHNVDDTIAKMQELKTLGIGFSMDDFGTGYSSLSCLKLLPLDQLKIDRSFIDGITSDANDAAIAQTIITMGKIMGLHVIAEGVETEGQLEHLCKYGCTSFQGYLFSRPVPIAEFHQLLAD